MLYGHFPKGAFPILYRNISNGIIHMSYRQFSVKKKKKSRCLCKDIFEIEHFPYCTDSFHVEQTFTNFKWIVSLY